MTEEYTAQKLRDEFGNDVAGQIIVERFLNPNPSYDTFVNWIYRSIDDIFGRWGRNRNDMKGLSEDQLSTMLVDSLYDRSFDASREENVGGHCDIIVERKALNYIWLGEAKKINVTNNVHLLNGFKQLVTRYSTGKANQNHGGLLVYCFAPRLDLIMAKWLAYFSEAVPDLAEATDHPFEHNIVSEHTHEGTGNTLFVRHFPVALYFAPQH